MSRSAAKDYIEGLAASTNSERIKEMRDLYNKKLWHNLTVCIEDFLSSPEVNSIPLVQFYESFVKDLQTHINQLKLIKVVLIVLKTIPDPTMAIQFLKKVTETINAGAEPEATSLALSETAYLLMERLTPPNLLEAKQLLDKVSVSITSLTGADSSVYSSYYKANSLYYKLKVLPQEYYKNSLMFLVYSPLEHLSVQEQQILSYSMGIAALVSKEIYNFGELLASPILASLDGTPREWLKHFLYAFNSGNINKFESLVGQYKVNLEQEPALKANTSIMREKISILALMELVFERPAEGRTLSFTDIAKASKLPEDEVELLVMKGLSLGLIRGMIDEVNKNVHIHWVQPRVLDVNQVGKMRDRIKEWSENVKQVLMFMENETAPELLA